MKLDVNQLRYLSNEEFRVLTAVEMGMKNHELVPTPLVERISYLRHGGCTKLLKSLSKIKLVHHDAKKYDGYYLTYPGYDFLALKTFSKRGLIEGVGRQIGVGKESDIYVVLNDKDEELVLKCQRLGRISFRQIKNKRDYFKGTKPSNWLYISRLAALKEYAFMKALYESGFPTPIPVSHNRHCVLMSKVNGYPLVHVTQMAHPQQVFKKCVDLIVKFAEYGLIHGDFNEFNIMCTDEEEIIVIDFPQMVSTSHPDAEEYFYRDLDCIHAFFNKRFGVNSDYYPNLQDIIKTTDLDIKVAASGFSKELEKELQNALDEQEGKEIEEEQDEKEIKKKELLINKVFENDIDNDIKKEMKLEELKEEEKKEEIIEEKNENLIQVKLIPQPRIIVDLIPKKKRIICELSENSFKNPIKLELFVPYEEHIQPRFSEEEIKKKVKRSLGKRFQRDYKKIAKGNAQKGKQKREQDDMLKEKFWEL